MVEKAKSRQVDYSTSIECLQTTVLYDTTVTVLSQGQDSLSL